MDPFRFSDYDYGLRARLRGTVLRALSSRALKNADRVVAVSRYTQDHMVDHLNISSDRIRQIYHGRDRGFTAVAGAGDVEQLEALGVKQGYILTCGSILPYRRTQDVIAAFGLLADSVRGERQLVIAGDGTDRPYRKLIESHIQHSPLSTQIRWVGHVPTEAMRVLYRNSALCVLATEVEACPNIAIEALSSGCAILASNRQPLPEILGDAAHYYPARDVTGLAFEMERILKSPDLASALGSKAAAQSQAFDWVTCAKQTYAALVDWPGVESPPIRQHAGEC